MPADELDTLLHYFREGGRDNLRGARGSAIYQNCDGKSCNRFCWIGIEGLAREFLALQISDRAVIQE